MKGNKRPCRNRRRSKVIGRQWAEMFFATRFVSPYQAPLHGCDGDLGFDIHNYDHDHVVWSGNYHKRNCNKQGETSREEEDDGNDTQIQTFFSVII